MPGRYLRDANRRAPGTVDWLQVDLYDARARGPVLDDAGFYRDCRRALRAGGVAAFNLFGSSLQPSLEPHQAGLRVGSWLRLPRSAAGNTVVLAFAADDARGTGPCCSDARNEWSNASACRCSIGWPASEPRPRALLLDSPMAAGASSRLP
jgi:hypothetical protein